MLSKNKNNLFSVILLIIIILINLFLPLERSNLKFKIGPTELNYSLILNLILFFLLILNGEFRKNIKIYFQTILCRLEILFVISMTISLFFTLSTVFFGIHLILLYINSYIIMIFIFMFIIEETNIKTIINIFSICLILFSLIGILEFFFEFIFPFYHNLYSDYFKDSYNFAMNFGSKRAFGSLGHPLLFSNMLILFLPIIWLERNNLVKILTISLIILGVISGNSRTSIFLLGFILLLYVFKSRIQIKLFIIFISILSPIMIINIVPDLYNMIFIRIEGFGSDASSLGRLLWLTAGFSRINTQPFINDIFGNGIGASKEILFQQIVTTWPTFDNNYMLITITIGFFGLLIYLLKYIYIVKNLIQKKEFDLFIGVILFLLMGFSFDTLHYTAIILPHSFLIALSIKKKAIT